MRQAGWRSWRIPVVVKVKWDACCVAAFEGARLFETLFGAVVAGFAKALQVQRIEEQFFASTVRLFVINDGGRCSDLKLKAVGAKRLALKLCAAKSFPFCGAVEAHCLSVSGVVDRSSEFVKGRNRTVIACASYRWSECSVQTVGRHRTSLKQAMKKPIDNGIHITIIDRKNPLKFRKCFRK